MWLKQNSGMDIFIYSYIGPAWIYIPHLLDPSRTGGPQPPGHRPVPVPGPLGAGGAEGTRSPSHSVVTLPTERKEEKNNKRRNRPAPR